jgi:hypothetical protein
VIEFLLLGLIIVVIGLNTEIIAYYKAGKNALIKSSVLIGAISVFFILVLTALVILFIASNQPTRAIIALLVDLIIIYFITPSETV